MAKHDFILLGDEPYTGEEDPLGFDKYAQGLTSLILTSRHSTPLSFGVQASWGMGKSTLMRRLEKALSVEPNTKTVWFNAWTFEGQAVLDGLIKIVLDATDPGSLRRALRRQKLISFFRIATSLAAGVWNHTLSNLVDSFWQTALEDPRARNQIQPVLQDAMDNWRKKAGPSSAEPLLAIFVDDLDRCSPVNVLQVFEAIKLYLNSTGIVFVIGFDSNIVSESVLEQKKYSKHITSSQYLEKIVQIDYTIPRPETEQIGKLLKSYLRASNALGLLGDEGEALVVERSNRNPRRMKRFINRFVIEHSLEGDSAAIAPELLVSSLMLRMYFPDFCALFVGNGEQNPITEFVEYLEVRNGLRRGKLAAGSLDGTRAAGLFRSYGIGEPDDSAEASISRLDEVVPEQFSQLAGDPDFLSLIRTLDKDEDRQKVAQRISRQRQAWELSIEEDAVPDEGPGPARFGLSGLRILWVDDQPNNNGTLTNSIKLRGATVHSLLDTDSAVAFFRGGNKVDLLLSDLRRGRDANSGFDLAAQLKAEGLFDGPVIFYGNRISNQNRRRAETLGAAGITRDPMEVLRLVDSVAAARTGQREQDSPTIDSRTP